MYEHVVSHGRTYHKYKDGSKLWIPNDGMSLMLFEEYLLPNDEVGLREKVLI